MIMSQIDDLGDLASFKMIAVIKNDNDDQFQAKLLGFLGEVESPWQTSSLPRSEEKN